MGRSGGSKPVIHIPVVFSSGESKLSTHSLDFYRRHAQRYAELSHEFIHSVYSECSHPALKGDMDLLNRLVELAQGRRGVDAGCGAGARDVYLLWNRGYDMYGLDAVTENIQIARDRHPEIADRLQVADLREPLPFPDASFDLALCNAVIQHIPAAVTKGVTLPELARVLRPGGCFSSCLRRAQGWKRLSTPLMERRVWTAASSFTTKTNY